LEFDKITSTAIAKTARFVVTDLVEYETLSNEKLLVPNSSNLSIKVQDI